MTSVMRIALLTGTSSHRGTVMTTTTDVSGASAEQVQPVRRPGSLQELDPEPRTTAHRLAVAIFTGVPMLALLVAVPVAWVWGLLNWQTILIAITFYLFSALAIPIGFH